MNEVRKTYKCITICNKREGRHIIDSCFLIKKKKEPLPYIKDTPPLKDKEPSKKIESIVETDNGDTVIKIEAEGGGIIPARYYIMKSLRSSNIPTEAQLQINTFDAIQHVKPDGNCGHYSIMEGLFHNHIEFYEDVDVFRKHIFDYIHENKDTLFVNISFGRKKWRGGKMRVKTRE